MLYAAAQYLSELSLSHSFVLTDGEGAYTISAHTKGKARLTSEFVRMTPISGDKKAFIINELPLLQVTPLLDLAREDMATVLHRWAGRVGKPIPRTHDSSRKGGEARNDSLTPKERSDIARNAAKTRWERKSSQPQGDAIQ